jgi:hypothetical protein
MPIAVGEANEILDAWAGRTTYTGNAAVWAKLHLADPGSAGTTSPAASTTRKQVTWAAAASQAVESSADLVWSGGDLTATETITHLSFWTASTAGTFLGSAALNASAAMTAGETLTIAAGSFDVSITGTKMSVGECNKALDAWAGTASYTASAAFCLKMHTGDPGTAGTTNAATETLRKAVTFGTAAASGAIANTAAISWTGITATGTESISWFSFWSATTGGTFLGRDDLATARSVTTGDGLDVAIGAVSLTVA